MFRRLSAREVGPTTIAVLVLLQGVLWAVARPAGEATGSYVGQLLGAESILLLSIGLVLISMLPQVEEWFDGIDRAAIWHRRVAIAGLVLLLPHVLLASGAGSAYGGLLAAVGAIGLVSLAVWAILPRWQSVVPRPLRSSIRALRDVPVVRQFRRLFGGYERWRSLHRTTGLFVAAGFLHGVFDGTPFDDAPILRWSYVAIGAVGLGFYVYRELLARFFLSLHDYEVDGVHEVDDDLVEVVLRPIGRAVHFVPGQFAMVYLEAKDGWHRHPFTISSAPRERQLRFTVKALGDYTSRLQRIIEPGMPAVVGGPHGRFNHAKGTDRQVWIAGGVGVAPFLSWLRALDGHLPREVDLFYTNDGEPPFADEMRGIADRHASLHLHLIDTGVEGRLTTEQVLETAACDPRTLSVFMCGPPGMLRTFETGLRLAGVPSRRIHREHFDWR
jgi:predicted ferric reductase